MSERTLSVARALTRIKTIKAQLASITVDIGRFATISDKKKHPLGANLGLLQNHATAKSEVSSLFQQFHDLTEEFLLLKDAVDRSNTTTTITIGDKTMTVNQALIYHRSLNGYVQALLGAYNGSVVAAERDVDKYNLQFVNITDEGAKQALLAQVLYLVPTDKIKELNTFLIEFSTTLNGLLNESNVITMISL